MDSIKITKYKCGICHTLYDTRDKAEKCCKDEKIALIEKIESNLCFISRFCKNTMMTYITVDLYKVNYMYHKRKRAMYNNLIKSIHSDSSYDTYKNDPDVIKLMTRLNKLYNKQNMKYLKFMHNLIEIGSDNITRLLGHNNFSQPAIAIDFTWQYFDFNEFVQDVFREVI